MGLEVGLGDRVRQTMTAECDMVPCVELWQLHGCIEGLENLVSQFQQETRFQKFEVCRRKLVNDTQCGKMSLGSEQDRSEYLLNAVKCMEKQS